MNNDDLDSGATLRGLAAGQHMFNRYKLIRVLGQGGMGVVWLAHDETLDQNVALKFLPEAVARDEEALRDLKRETKRALRLTHPRIVRIYDFVSDARNAAVSMEYVDGRTLTSLKLEAAEGCLGTAELAPWIGQLCEALTYAHNEAGVVHRDLKPANLMIDSKGTLKVTDFGISATITDSTTRASTNAASTSGTPVYMSPQQMLGTRAAPTDDVYSLGATIYELLTGKPPFYSGNIPMQVQGVVPPTMTERRKELGVEDAAPIPEAWEKTVTACLAKEAKNRPQSAVAVWERLNGRVAPSAQETTSSVNPQFAQLEAPMVAERQQTKEAEESSEPWIEKPGFIAAVCIALVALAVQSHTIYGIKLRVILLCVAFVILFVSCWMYGIRALELKRRHRKSQQTADPWPMLKKPGFIAAICLALVALVACGWWYGIRVPELARQAEQARQLEVARQEAADKAAEAQRLREEQARKDAAAQAEQERQAAEAKAEQERQAAAAKAEQERQLEVARQEAARKAEEEANARGTLIVTSTPTGAEVIDSTGKNCGTTPLRFEEIKPGNYTMTLKMAGYEDSTVSGDVAKHETLRLYASMKEVARPEQQAVAASTPSYAGSSDAPSTGRNWMVPDYNIEMIYIAPGTFNMGEESSPHRVTLTQGYWLGKYEVTQGQWQAVMGNNPSGCKNAGANAPVENVSWEDAQAFCKKLTDKERAAGRLPSGYEYSLPTEAQWEYACRAGTTTTFSYGSDEGSLWQYGNYCDKSNTNDFSWKDKTHNDGNDKTAPVGSYKPNAWGLYDMHGNVWEWCNDWYGTYPSGSVTDPTGPNGATYRVFRGGCWYYYASICRSATRDFIVPGSRHDFLGFRLALRSVQ